MKKSGCLSTSEVAQARQRRREAMHLQEIEGNPLDADQVAMFEMFERERWPHDRCLAYILAKDHAVAAERSTTTSVVQLSEATTLAAG